VVRRVTVSEKLTVGERVVIPWGVDDVEGTVAEVYGVGPAERVVVSLTPEASGYVVDEPTTVTLPAHAVRRPGVAA
jgi:hypothetical protein